MGVGANGVVLWARGRRADVCGWNDRHVMKFVVVTQREGVRGSHAWDRPGGRRCNDPRKMGGGMGRKNDEGSLDHRGHGQECEVVSPFSAGHPDEVGFPSSRPAVCPAGQGKSVNGEGGGILSEPRRDLQPKLHDFLRVSVSLVEEVEDGQKLTVSSPSGPTVPDGQPIPFHPLCEKMEGWEGRHGPFRGSVEGGFPDEGGRRFSSERASVGFVGGKGHTQV